MLLMISIIFGSLSLMHLIHAVSLEEALLTDLVPDDANPSSCKDPGTSSFTFAFPGTNANSKWYAGPCYDQSEYPDAPCHNFTKYEAEDMFLAELSHADPNNPNRTWIMRFAQGGNIYLFYSPNTFGEAMPPQYHDDGPWIDEVHQSVAVSPLNKPPAGVFYFIHQAGTYQRDPEYTGSPMVAGNPFYSPNVAKHCSGNTCTFASWGQQAHVPTKFASKVLYIHRYRNCGEGIIEHTQTIQNFAETESANQELRYFNVPWGGVRTSNLPDTLEPDASGGFNIDPVHGDVRTVVHPFGLNEPGAMVDLKNTGGYTTFASGIWPNNTVVPLDLPCIKPGMHGECYNKAMPNDPNNCLVTSCTDEQVLYENFTRMGLVVPNSGTACTRHSASRPDSLLIACQFHPIGFGRNSGGGKNSGGQKGEYSFRNPTTGAEIRFKKVHHWSWGASDDYSYFWTFNPDTVDGLNRAKNDVAAAFPPGSMIEATTYHIPEPPGYDPTILPSLTFVYGKGDEYNSGGTVKGYGRRRLGLAGSGPRDYTVFTINHIDTVEPGSTYFARQYMINGELGAVEANAKRLVSETYMDELDEQDYRGRPVQLYTNEDGESTFGAAVSDVAGGFVTSCSQGTSKCFGSTTPGYKLRPYFYIECGDSNETYFGPDTYYFMPNRNHTEDIFYHSGAVRAYACEGEPTNARPNLKLIGYFPDSAGCKALEKSRYDASFCDRRSSIFAGERGSTVPAALEKSMDSDDGGAESLTQAPTSLSSANNAAADDDDTIDFLQTLLAVHKVVSMITSYQKP